MEQISDAADTFRRLGDTLQEAMVRHHVPGVAVGVLADGREWVAAYGITSVEHPLPVEADTLFQIGSITKTITGTALMRLAEMGRLDVNVPVRTYLPDFRLSSEAVAAKVTLRHLLTHAGGWAGDFFADTGPGDDALARIVAGMAHLEQLTPLGTVWSYNNAGFYAAGRLIEVVTVRPYEEAVQELVLDPLRMRHSYFHPADVLTHRVVAGHHVDAERAVVARPWALPRAAHPIGGLISSVPDLLRYARLHLADRPSGDAAPLAPASVAAMQAPQIEASGGMHWGLSWGLRRAGGVRIVTHGGATRGQTATFVLAPERRFALAVLTNSDRGSALYAEITPWALRHFLGLEDPVPSPLPLSGEDLRPYAGRYVGALATSDLDLVPEGDHLRLRVLFKGGFPKKDTPPPPPLPLMRAGLFAPDRLIILDGPMKETRGEFLRGPDGMIEWLRVSRIRRAALPGPG
jgi:CubicO group peptidase (beta-lactamase class C family)